MRSPALIGALLLCAGVSASDEITLESMEALHGHVCAEARAVSASPWSIHELYRCGDRTLYIPYQLWTGAHWDGERGDCMHAASTAFRVNGVSATRITGPVRWRDPHTGGEHSVWRREKVDGSKTQLFTCHARGIGRVYDSRGERTYRAGRCKFPAGYGWRIAARRHCRDTSIEIRSIMVDPTGKLAAIEFKWWFGDTLDHIYRYEPSVSARNSWRQPRDG